MKRKGVWLSLALLLGVGLIWGQATALAASEDYVPAGDWSYQAIRELVASGLGQRTLLGKINSGRLLTRWQMALRVAELLGEVEEQSDGKLVHKESGRELTPAEVETLLRLGRTYQGDLAGISGLLRQKMTEDINNMERKLALNQGALRLNGRTLGRIWYGYDPRRYLRKETTSIDGDKGIARVESWLNMNFQFDQNTRLYARWYFENGFSQTVWEDRLYADEMALIANIPFLGDNYSFRLGRFSVGINQLIPGFSASGVQVTGTIKKANISGWLAAGRDKKSLANTGNTDYDQDRFFLAGRLQTRPTKALAVNLNWNRLLDDLTTISGVGISAVDSLKIGGDFTWNFRLAGKNASLEGEYARCYPISNLLSGPEANPRLGWRLVLRSAVTLPSPAGPRDLSFILTQNWLEPGFRGDFGWVDGYDANRLIWPDENNPQYWLTGLNKVNYRATGLETGYLTLHRFLQARYQGRYFTELVPPEGPAAPPRRLAQDWVEVVYQIAQHRQWQTPLRLIGVWSRYLTEKPAADLSLARDRQGQQLSLWLREDLRQLNLEAGATLLHEEGFEPGNVDITRWELRPFGKIWYRFAPNTSLYINLGLARGADRGNPYQRNYLYVEYNLNY